MAKVVYSACYGGFGLSDAAVRRYAEIKGLTLYPEPMMMSWHNTGITLWWTVPPSERAGKVVDDWQAASAAERQASNAFWNANQLQPRDISRTDPVLVQVVEELGPAASGEYANLRIAELPEGTHYRIDEYDGFESVETRDDIEWSVA